MEELIQRVAAAAGISPDTARESLGVILGFIRKHAPEGPMQEMLNSIPGGEAAIEENAGGGGGGGLMGALGGMFGGSAGGLMAIAGQLQGKGLDMGQMKTVGQEIFRYGEEQIGEDKMKEIFKSIPGVSAMM